MLPGIVLIKIIPQNILDAVAPDCLTPISIIVAAYNYFLADENRQTGEVLECSANNHFIIPVTKYANDRISKRVVTVWEPLFKIAHGENSGLSDAIP